MHMPQTKLFTTQIMGSDLVKFTTRHTCDTTIERGGRGGGGGGGGERESMGRGEDERKNKAQKYPQRCITK